MSPPGRDDDGMNDHHDEDDLPAEVWAAMSETERLAYLVALGEPVPPEVTQAALDAFPGES